MLIKFQKNNKVSKEQYMIKKEWRWRKNTKKREEKRGRTKKNMRRITTIRGKYTKINKWKRRTWMKTKGEKINKGSFGVAEIKYLTDKL